MKHITLLLALSITSARAAETITWGELQAIATNQPHGRTNLDVITKEGKMHRADWVHVREDSLDLYDKDNRVSSLGKGTIKRIKVPRRKRSSYPENQGKREGDDVFRPSVPVTLED